MFTPSSEVTNEQLDILTELQQVIERGEFSKARKILSENSQSKDNYFSVSIKFLQIRLLIYTGEYNKALVLARTLYEDLSNVDNDLLQFESIIWYTEVLVRNLRLDKAWEIYQEGKNYFTNYSTSKLPKPLELLGRYIYVKTLIPLNITGGRLKDQQNMIMLAKQCFNQIDYKFGLGLLYNNLGYSYFVSGDMQRSLDAHLNALDLREEVGNPHQIAYSHCNIGIVYRDLDQEHLVVHHLNKGMEMMKELGNEVVVAEILWNLAIYAYRYNRPENELLSFLEEIELMDQKNDYIRYYTNFIRGIVLKNHSRIRIKFQAEKIFKKLISHDFVYIYTKLLLIELLIDLLIDELKLYSNIEVLEEIKYYNSIHFELTDQMGSSYYQVTSLIFQSKLYLLEGKLEQATNLLDSAYILSKENHLLKLEKLVLAEKDHLETNLFYWKQIVDSNIPMYERINQTNIATYLNIVRKIYSEES